ncbi:MAG: hypothetical protein A2V87_00485 [Deltaproteobacteria bacterium RBG_16_58_17]|nr:MAG: hypothetical protein A2V87_00485 [Deltaproteobacteria bacterium RBG_16_58_17]OHE16871.1 MAG: hypothetical protein A2X96_02545 [Syntrophobacterales bacterium GWC2_56_13]
MPVYPFYKRMVAAEQTGKKVAWITSGGPVEPLIAMDVIPVYPENHGASKMGVDLCEKIEAMGYSSDLCSYARADIACAPINGGPIGGLPRPDMLVCCNFLETMAEGYSRIYLNIGVDEMDREVMAMADKYEVDGIVMHSNRSCKPYSFGQCDIQRIIREKKRIPTVMIEADMVDERSFSESQIETRIDAFIEVMKEGKRVLGSVH